MARGIYCRKVLKTRDRNHAFSQASEETILSEWPGIKILRLKNENICFCIESRSEFMTHLPLSQKFSCYLLFGMNFPISIWVVY